VDPRHLATLEFPKILDRLASFTSFSAGESLARALTPASVAEEIRERLEVTAEARRLLQDNPAIGLGGARDVRPLATAAERGRLLQPDELLAVASTLLSARSLRGSVTRLKREFPLLGAIASRLEPCDGVRKEIERCLDDAGALRDTASPELGRLRRQIRHTRDRIKEKLSSIINSPRNARFLQEAVVTQRGGRHVIPLKADFKGRIPGVVHDSSGSGATLFVEPLPVVELNNACRELEIAEHEEEERILSQLTDLVAAQADPIRQNVEALAEIDLALAKARYADEIEATVPEVLPLQLAAKKRVEGHPGSSIRFSAARHPLLHPETAVPIDVELDEETFIVVITGPNTGGKTVALKTVGLLTMMAQAGLHIPAGEGSAFSPFEAIYADIGDEQSIEQSLSTFSAHLTNILSFLDEVGSRSLVLLDELGAGTDPTEGAALARSLLDHFRARQATTFVATHYPALKAYAQLTPGVSNACVEFDPKTLSPTYKLTIGLPGRSNALSIAERLGLPKEIADSARSSLSREDLRADDMLADIHALRLQAAQARDEAAAARAEARKLSADLREKLDGIDEERVGLLAAARDEAEAEIAALRSEISSLRRRLRAAVAPLDEISSVEEAVDELEEGMPSPELAREPAVPPEGPVPQKAGDPVFVRTLGVQGTVIAINGEEAEVQIGPARGRFPLASLSLSPVEPISVSSGSPRLARPSPSPGAEIQVRGLTIDEALPLVDRHIDAAFRAGLPSIRVVHGKGTGSLRRAVRDLLDDHPLVSSHEPARPAEGGEGATVVHLAER
jgi:DNA mismatch repair protein MutS2